MGKSTLAEYLVQHNFFRKMAKLIALVLIAYAKSVLGERNEEESMLNVELSRLQEESAELSNKANSLAKNIQSLSEKMDFGTGKITSEVGSHLQTKKKDGECWTGKACETNTCSKCVECTVAKEEFVTKDDPNTTVTPKPGKFWSEMGKIEHFRAELMEQVYVTKRRKDDAAVVCNEAADECMCQTP